MPAAHGHRATLGQILFLARKNLFESRLTTALLVAAVAAGVGFQIPNRANMAGYEAELLQEGITAGQGDVRVRSREGMTFEDATPLVERLRGYSGVRAVVPVLMLPAAIKGKGPLIGTVVVGVDTKADFRPFRMTSGEPLGQGDSEGALVGLSLAETLEIKLGDSVSLRAFLNTGPTILDEDDLGRYTMTVRGLAGGTFGAQQVVFLDRTFLAEQAGTPKGASMLLVYLDDHFAAQGVAQRISADLPRVQARAWMDDSAYLSSSIRASHAVGVVSQTMVIVAVAIPVFALLYIIALGRRREIGLLTAMGFGPGEIFSVFFAQAAVVGLMGTLLGCGAGYGLIRFFQMHPIFEWKGFVIRPVLDWTSFAQPTLVVLTVTLLAGVYPALRAARMDPAPVFRGIV
jgi:ABC-type lipoprotein release transport system permease subunit